MQISVDLSSIEELASKVQNARAIFSSELQDKMVESVNGNIVTVARSLAPVRSGALRDSIYAEPVGELEVDLVADLYYADFMEFGTRPHDIFGNPVLHWQKGGQDFFATSVHHPGTRPYLFMRGGIEQGLEHVLQDLTDFIAGLFVD